MPLAILLSVCSTVASIFVFFCLYLLSPNPPIGAARNLMNMLLLLCVCLFVCLSVCLLETTLRENDHSCRHETSLTTSGYWIMLLHPPGEVYSSRHLSKNTLMAGNGNTGCCIQCVSAGEVDLTQADESFDIPKPLIVALRELGPCTGPVVRILVEAGADVGVQVYTGRSILLSINYLVQPVIQGRA